MSITQRHFSYDSEGLHPPRKGSVARAELLMHGRQMAKVGPLTMHTRSGVATPRRIVRTVNSAFRTTQLVQLDRTPSNTPSAAGSVTAFSEDVDDMLSEMTSDVLEGNDGAVYLWSRPTDNDNSLRLSPRASGADSMSYGGLSSVSGDPFCSAPLVSCSREPSEAPDVESVCTNSTTYIGEQLASGVDRVPISGAIGISLADTMDASGTLVAHCPFPGATLTHSTYMKEASRPRRVMNVRFEERIGRGRYGDVFRVTDLDTGRELAVKQVFVSSDLNKDTEKQLCALEREIRVMRKLNHKHIVKYYSSRRDEDCTALLIYMEYISGGTIASKLKANGPFNEEETRVYTKQLLKGLSYLHRRRIIHRDLKGDNLFVTTDGILKVGDFGTSKDLQATVETNSVAGTPNFMAPEVINCSGHSYMADIWSVGCCVLEMLSGHPPFWKLDNCMAVMFAILRGELEKHIPDHLSEEAADFISQCTRTNPKERLTASQLLRHPWITGARGGASVRSESAMGYSLTSASFQDDRIAAFDRRKASTSLCDSTELSRVSLYSSHFCPTQVAARGQDSERLLECESAPKSCMSSARRHLSFSHSSSTIAIAMDRSPIVPRGVRRRSTGKSVTITTVDALPPIVGG